MINKEGYRIISITTGLIVVLSLLSFFCLSILSGFIITIVLAFILLGVILFFRDPRRETSRDDGVVLAPADGTVVAVEEITEKEYFKDRRMQVSVFMSVSNIHVNWYPVSGNIEYVKYHPGKFLVAWLPKSSEENERTTVVIGGDRHKIMYRQIAGFVARRIVYYPVEGETVQQSTRSGFIKFGSRVDLILPPDSVVKVRIGQKVKGALTPIAELR